MKILNGYPYKEKIITKTIMLINNVIDNPVIA